MSDKDIIDFETLLKEIQQLKFELKCADESYERESAKKDKVIAEMKSALEYVKTTIDNMEDAWWIDCPNKGGFDTDIIENAIKLGDE